jgi:uncharacterized surface protein with fasciclin (FAS1) repeats
MRSILDTIFNIRELQMFSTTIQIVSLNQALHSAGPFTIFAPHDRAFTRLSKVVMQQLTSNVPLLTKTIHTHIVKGNVTYEDLLIMCKKGERSVTLKSIDGLPLHIDLSDGIGIGDATVITADIGATNGTIHSIDRILIPKLPKLTYPVSWIDEVCA